MATAEGGTVSPDEILEAFQRNVRRMDNWRGYIGDDADSPTDDEVHAVLQQARVEIAGPRGGARIAEQLYLRVVELERQRDEVLALCDEAEQDEPSAIFNQGGPMWAIWTADIRKAYGGRQ